MEINNVVSIRLGFIFLLKYDKIWNKNVIKYKPIISKLSL